MNAPMSETTSATNRLRKVDTRSCRHKLDEPGAPKFFSAVSVNRPCPLDPVSQAVAKMHVLQPPAPDRQALIKPELIMD
jgi:hypothetical protein